MSVSPPPVREQWKTDKDGRLVSLPWILWFQQLATIGQAEDVFSNVLTLVSTAESTTQPSSNGDVDLSALNVYTPSSSSVLLNDAEMLTWMSF